MDLLIYVVVSLFLIFELPLYNPLHLLFVDQIPSLLIIDDQPIFWQPPPVPPVLEGDLAARATAAPGRGQPAGVAWQTRMREKCCEDAGVQRKKSGEN